MQIAIVTFEGFNEIDSFVALNILNRVKEDGWQAQIVGPGDRLTSMNGVVIQPQQPLAFANEADVVLFGSGRQTRQMIQNDELMAALRFDPARQLIGSQCSGALILNRLGLLTDRPACTDSTTRPWLEAAGVTVLPQPFLAEGNLATAGGCLSSVYLAAWVILRLRGEQVAADALGYAAPVGEETSFIAHALETVKSHDLTLTSLS